MKRCVLMFLVAMATAAWAVTPSPYQQARLITADITKAAESGSLGGNCYELALQYGEELYIADQCAQFFWNEYAPHEFTEGGTVQVRLEKDKLMLLRPNGKELKARIVRRVKWDGTGELPERLRRGISDMTLSAR